MSDVTADEHVTHVDEMESFVTSGSLFKDVKMATDDVCEYGGSEEATVPVCCCCVSEVAA